MAEFRSIRDVFRDPLIIAVVLVGAVGILWVGGSLLSLDQDQVSQEINQPGTQSLPADDKDQPNYQAPPITQPSTQAPATGETTP
jgi:hypothetical protein